VDLPRTRHLALAVFLGSVFLGSVALAIPFFAAAPPHRVSLTLLGTTDIHGNLMPVDYYANRAAERGLAKVATLVKRIRAEQPNSLLLDSGDTIQGTPLAFYYARKDPTKPNPTIAVMNALRYDAMSLGNHEFNYGLAVMWKAKREADFPWLAANVKQKYKPGENGYFVPYIIKQVAGLNVGIVGFVTPGIPRWEVPENYAGYEFEPIVEAARRVVPEIRKKADLVVVITHTGLGRDPKTGEAPGDQMVNENVAWDLAQAVPQIDVIFYGHTHQEMPQLMVNGVLLAQARNWAQSLARADIEMEREGEGAWRVASKKSMTIPVTSDVPADPEIVKLAEPYHLATQAYLDTPVATSEKAMDGSLARYEDHPFLDLIHTVQMQYGKADVSLATMLFSGARVPAGQVTIRQIAAIYIYDNTLFTVEMTGAQLRQALETAAGYFPAWPFPADGRIRLPGYNADTAQGVSYKVDISRPAGQRIVGLTYRGKPLADDEKLRVATNNYRYAGGGQYAVFKGLPVLYRSPQEIRELLIEYVGKTGRIPATADGNWEIVPPAAREALVAEIRRREQQGADTFR